LTKRFVSSRPERWIPTISAIPLETAASASGGTTDEHMIRIKVKWGKSTADQLDVLADVARITPSPKAAMNNPPGHPDAPCQTPRRDVPPAPDRRSWIDDARSCGNTVRN